MRIISGNRKGMTLKSPQDRNIIRPTTDRVKENIFNILEHNYLPDGWPHLRVLDLCAGTGALGLEALSRGASYCVFVDTSPEARGLIRGHLEQMDAMAKAKIFRRNIKSLSTPERGEKFQLVFADPPYGKNFGATILDQLAKNEWLSEGAAIVFEEASTTDLPTHPLFILDECRTYGESQIGIYLFKK